METFVVETESLTKRYGKYAAVNRMSIHVRKGDIYGLIGKNGAGKTTLMKLILGLSLPNEGSIRLFGGVPTAASAARIGSLIEAPALYKGETAFENLKRFAILSPTPDEEIKGLLKLVGLADVGNKKAGAFSLGMKQRLGIAVALLGNPDVLILDEPINGLDPAGIKEVRDLIVHLNRERGVTFLISSHLLDELGKIATKYGIVSQGKLVEEITAEDLREKCVTALRVSTDDGARAEAILKKQDPTLKIERQGNILHIGNEAVDPAAVNRTLVTDGVNVDGLRHDSLSLEDFFIQRMEA